MGTDMDRKTMIDYSTASASSCWLMCRAIGWADQPGCRRRAQPDGQAQHGRATDEGSRRLFCLPHGQASLGRRHPRWRADDDFILKRLKDSFDLHGQPAAAPVRTRKIIRLSDRLKRSSIRVPPTVATSRRALCPPA